ncbi:MAG: hypothetical protein IKZ82_05585 [Clostridia bacterium]|nr:hypothetical protein [Clostridia bacterium]
MKHKRILSLLMGVTLLIGFCYTGCARRTGSTVSTETPTPEVSAVPTEPPATADPNGIPVRWQNGGKLSFLPEEPLSIPKLSEMRYVRPDAEKLIADIETLTNKVPGCDDAEALLNDYYPIAVQIHNLSSMDAISFCRYCMDMNDSYFADEYNYCEEQSGIVEEKENTLYAAFAGSPCRDALEQAYFGEGFFLAFDDFNAGAESYFDLKQQENDLLFQYYELASTADFTNYSQIEKNHETSGTIFIELVKTRQKIAASKGYENYMDYSYACDYRRDYSTAQAREYLTRVKAVLAPLMQNSKIADQYSYYSNWNESKSMEMLSAAAERMGGPVWESFRFLSGYELYDISRSQNKMAIAYTGYIGNYESPYIFVDPYSKDLLIALFHEFGHFTDWYYNYCFEGDYETAETYSQSMQYLAFASADSFSDKARAENLRATLSDLLVYSVLQEGAYADFELQVYALAPEELTVENLDVIFGQCMEDYGIAGVSGVRFKSNYWSVYQHFFTYPGYVISYSDSAVAAMQICRLEAENPGAGVDAFCRLLNRTHGKKFAAVLAETGLDSPFEEAALEKTAAFLKDAFDMN